MARSLPHEINWKPRRQRKGEALARVAHLQKNLPAVVQEVFAGDERRVAPVPAEPVPLPKKSKFAVLHWEPRSQARANADVGSQSETANPATQ